MPDRRMPEPTPNDRPQPIALSLPELVALAVEGSSGFRLEEMLDRIEARR